MAKPTKKFDESLFTPEELKKIAADAKSEHEAKKKAEATREAKAHYLERLERAEDPTQQTESVYIDLPPYADRLIIDGTIYMHGGRFDVPAPRVAVLYEQMARAWNHQLEIEGKKKDYHKARGFQLGYEAGVVTTRRSFAL